jgi:hypothetical protein
METSSGRSSRFAGQLLPLSGNYHRCSGAPPRYQDTHGAVLTSAARRATSMARGACSKTKGLAMCRKKLRKRHLFFKLHVPGANRDGIELHASHFSRMFEAVLEVPSFQWRHPRKAHARRRRLRVKIVNSRLPIRRRRYTFRAGIRRSVDRVSFVSLKARADLAPGGNRQGLVPREVYTLELDKTKRRLMQLRVQGAVTRASCTEFGQLAFLGQPRISSLGSIFQPPVQQYTHSVELTFGR